MTYFRLLYLSISTGLLATALTDKWKQNFTTVNAQEKKKRGRDEDLDEDVEICPKRFKQADDSCQDVEKRSGIKTPPNLSKPEFIPAIFKPPAVPTGRLIRRDPKKKPPSSRRKLFTGNQPTHTVNWVNFESGGSIFPHPKFPIRKLIEYKDAIICYDNQTKLACWTFEDVTLDNIDNTITTLPLNRVDCEIPDEFSASVHDYNALPKEYKLLQQHAIEPDLHRNNMEELCVFTNVLPQKTDPEDDNMMPTLWNELRLYIWYLTREFSNVYVLTGALFSPEKTVDCKLKKRYQFFGYNRVSIPTHFFKVIYAENDKEVRLECYKFPNKFQFDVDLRNYLVPRHELEKETGFLIFSAVKDENVTEDETDTCFCISRYIRSHVGSYLGTSESESSYLETNES